MKILSNPKSLKKYIDKHLLNTHFTDFNINYFELHKFEKNEYICVAGQKLNYLYFLIEGSANVFLTLKDGRQILISYLIPFHVIGDVELKRFGISRLDVVASQECLAIALPFEIINSKLGKDFKFWQYAVETISEKLESTTETLIISSLYPFKIKFAHHLLNSTTKDDIVNFDSLTSLAVFLGVSYRQLLRVVHEFENDGIIKKHKSSFQIENFDKLEILLVDF
ncbi:cyclic nucleotide-binding domain-containing protein [Haliovirga abyssi]|uniref:Catabolite gene activator protein n=1 Tax=Haliovirga abyssi TaxID=2996794 RepID=A0AAU9DYM8_9FUSO|nr:cyclic nucleotide-binding domain-containing protein [Haliovirga abyssi]BDU51631.1 catabolite gene activator protein [Haliovirga abyssi]